MYYNLFINYYVDRNPSRQEELDFCFLENLKNPVVSKIVVFVSEQDKKHLSEKFHEHTAKIHSIVQESRPTYNDFFEVMNHFGSDDNINAITNSDIIVSDNALQLSYQYLITVANCLALSRWDVFNKDNYKTDCTLFARADSQDTWIFKGKVGKIEGADFTMGIAGCDNAIAHYLQNAGFVLMNPCTRLQTYHLHLSNIRNYIQGEHIQRIPPPYVLVQPT